MTTSLWTDEVFYKTYEQVWKYAMQGMQGMQGAAQRSCDFIGKSNVALAHSPT